MCDRPTQSAEGIIGKSIGNSQSRHPFRINTDRTSPANWCLKYCSAKRLGFPFGEAGTPIGSSEPIGVTEEGWYRVGIRCAVGKGAAFRSFSILLHRVCYCCRWVNLFRPSVRTGAPSPKGKARRCAQQYCKQQFVPMLTKVGI